MPEVVTKHPEKLLKMLDYMNMKCGPAYQAKILTSCPKQQFCMTPNGKAEVCVYHPNDIGQMTQMNSLEFLRTSELFIPCLSIAVMLFIAGMMAGMAINRRR